MKERTLHAYHDGELGPLGRWRVRRALARSADARRELERLAAMGRLVRESAAEAPGPELWTAIQARLPAAARPLPEVAAGPAPWLRWAAPALAAAAAVALVWTLSIWGAEPALDGSVRWLHAGDKSAVVLQDDREATIIWVLDTPAGTTSWGAHGARA